MTIRKVLYDVRGGKKWFKNCYLQLSYLIFYQKCFNIYFTYNVFDLLLLFHEQNYDVIYWCKFPFFNMVKKCYIYYFT